MYIPRHCRQYLNGEPDPQQYPRHECLGPLGPDISSFGPAAARALDNRQNLRVKLWLGENCISAHMRTRRMNRGNAATCRHTPNVFSIARQCRKLIARSGNAALCMRGNAATCMHMLAALPHFRCALRLKRQCRERIVTNCIAALSGIAAHTYIHTCLTTMRFFFHEAVLAHNKG